MLGISIYPDKSSKEEILNYIDKTAKLGFKRIFPVYYQ
ncbi:MAG: MupG family TIM beta-alpha barrel fold protein [Sarcina sp.]